MEIAFDGVQTSPRYPGGVALRFARVVRHRPDKPAAEMDTLEAVLAVGWLARHGDAAGEQRDDQITIATMPQTIAAVAWPGPCIPRRLMSLRVRWPARCRRSPGPEPIGKNRIAIGMAMIDDDHRGSGTTVAGRARRGGVIGDRRGVLVQRRCGGLVRAGASGVAAIGSSLMVVRRAGEPARGRTARATGGDRHAASMNSGISQLQPRSRPVTSALFIAWSAMHGNSDPVNQNNMQAAKPNTAIIGSSSGG